MPRKDGRPHGLVGFDEAAYRLEHGGRPRSRGGDQTRWERAVRTWEGVIVSARELDVTPWNLLLRNVGQAAYQVEWIGERLREAEERHGGDLSHPEVVMWLAQYRYERELSMKTSKAAVDCGVAERLVRQTELESRILVTVLGRTFDDLTNELVRRFALGREDVIDLRRRMLDSARRELLAVESGGDLDSEATSHLLQSSAGPSTWTDGLVPVAPQQEGAPGDQDQGVDSPTGIPRSPYGDAGPASTGANPGAPTDTPRPRSTGDQEDDAAGDVGTNQPPRVRVTRGRYADDD